MIAKAAILYRIPLKIARSWAKDALVGLAFGVSIIALMWLLGHLPMIYSFIFGATQ